MTEENKPEKEPMTAEEANQLVQEETMRVKEIEGAKFAMLTVGVAKVSAVEKFLLGKMTKEEFEDAVNKTDEGIKKLGDFTEEKTKEYVEWQKGLLERLK